MSRYLMTAVRIEDDETGESRELTSLEITPEDWEIIHDGLSELGRLDARQLAEAIRSEILPHAMEAV